MKSASSVLKFAISGRNGKAPRLLFSFKNERNKFLLVSQQQLYLSNASGAGGMNTSENDPSRVESSSSNFTSPPVGSLSTSGAKKDDGDSGDGRSNTISKAMNAYLKRAKEHQEFLNKQENEFVFGRRHLANMMGKDPEHFTQKDIDEAIRYLFPSGLYEPRARPMMKPPAEIYPKQKSAQFDVSGRPHHPFFYTAKPNFYYLLHEAVGKLNSMTKLAPSKSELDPEDSLLGGSVWLSKEDLEERLLEKINDQMYNEWITCFERIAAHPKRDRELDFIKSYRKPLAKQARTDELPPITLEPDGRKSVHIPLCINKTARADVLVTVPGTGQFKINGKDLNYFVWIQSREAVIAPIQLVGWLGKVDVEANCQSGVGGVEKVGEIGESSRAQAVRYGIANALAALGADVEKLRLAGYIQQNRRGKERKKNARDGARAKWTWKKR